MNSDDDSGMFNSFCLKSLYSDLYLHSAMRNISLISNEDEEEFLEENDNDMIFTAKINEYINSNEDIEKDEFNGDKFPKNLKNDFYEEKFSEISYKEDIKKEKPLYNFAPNLVNNSNSSIFQNNSKMNDISFYDNDLDKTIQNLANFSNKDNSTFSNKKRGRSPKFKKDLNKINNNEAIKTNKSNEVIIRKNYKNFFEIKKNNNNLFKIKNNNNIGRKKKGSGLIGKHDKYYFDNISKGIKSLSFDYIREELNSELEKLNNSELINFKFLKFNNKQAINSSKEYNRNLMNKTFKEIFSEKISGKYNHEEDYNKKLIDKIYKLNETQNDENIERLIHFFDLKYNDFWAILSTYINTKDKQKYMETINDKYSFFKDLIKNFIFKVDKTLNEKNLDENYKAIFKLVLEDFPQRF